MSKQFDRIEDAHRKFVEEQSIFFVGSAARDGRVNVSPKGMDSLRVLAPDRIVWRNLTGSGNETAGHVGQVNRMTLMWCSFDARPMILRCYGQARIVHPRDPDWQHLNSDFEPDEWARQIFDVTVDLIQTSCGYGVPLMDYRGDRDTLQRALKSKGEGATETYWAERNTLTIDGYPTDILGQDA